MLRKNELLIFKEILSPLRRDDIRITEGYEAVVAEKLQFTITMEAELFTFKAAISWNCRDVKVTDVIFFLVGIVNAYFD